MSVPQLLRSRKFQVLIGLLVVVGIIWVALPSLVTAVVNHQLARMDAYTGEVRSVSLNLWRNAYRVEDLRLVNRQAPDRVPVVQIPVLDVVLDWGSLLRGNVIAEIDAHNPELNYLVAPEIVPDPDPPELHEALAELLSFRIDRLTVHDGEIHYRNFTESPEVNIYIEEFQTVVRNLTNDPELSESLVAQFEGRGILMGSGNLTFEGSANPMAEQPTFNLEFELKRLKLERMSDLLKAQTGLGPEAGTLSMDTELTGRNGRISGQADTTLRDLRITQIQAEDEGVLGRLWGAARRAADPVLRMPPDTTISVRIPIDVDLDDPAAGVWSSIRDALRSAFADALPGALENILRRRGGGD